MGHRTTKKDGFINVHLPSGDIAAIDSGDRWILEEFPHWRINNVNGRIRSVMLTRYIKTDYGSVREDRYLHLIVMSKSPRLHGYQIDHKDRNPLNNRKNNLRWVTPSQNARNSKKRSRIFTSEYRGVHKTKVNKSNPWVSQIKIDGKAKHLGCFKTARDAAIAYNKISAELYGEYGWKNDIGD